MTNKAGFYGEIYWSFLSDNFHDRKTDLQPTDFYGLLGRVILTVFLFVTIIGYQIRSSLQLLLGQRKVERF